MEGVAKAADLTLAQKAIFGEWLAIIIDPRREVWICVGFNVLIYVRCGWKCLRITTNIDSVLPLIYPNPIHSHDRRERQML